MMNNFKESLKLVQDTYKKQGHRLEFKDKVALAVHNAILEIETENQEEDIMKKEYLMNLNKIICNYEELRPILTRYFENKRNKWER